MIDCSGVMELWSVVMQWNDGAERCSGVVVWIEWSGVVEWSGGVE